MKWMLLYLSAILLANLPVALFGPSVAVMNAFLFIGLDLTARDKLHDLCKESRLAQLIALGSLISN